MYDRPLVDDCIDQPQPYTQLLVGLLPFLFLRFEPTKASRPTANDVFLRVSIRVVIVAWARL
jgi:hypothetical protein